MQSKENIAIIGAGKVGQALGSRFVQSGIECSFGARKPASELGELARLGAVLPLEEAAQKASILFLAVPGDIAVEATEALGNLEGKVLVDCTNPLHWEQGPVWDPPVEGSTAAALARVLPGALVVKAFNTFGAEFHGDPRTQSGPVDVYMASDSQEAKRRVAALAEQSGFRPLDAGPLRNAGLLENLAVLWIHMAMVGGQGRQVAFKLVGR